jgi:hypothetical protein
MFYGDLIQDMLPDIPRDDDNEDYRQRAEQIVDAILDRGGRFVKLNDPNCHPNGKVPAIGALMDRRASIHKVNNALRTAHWKWLKLHGRQTTERQRPVVATKPSVRAKQAPKKNKAGSSFDEGDGSIGERGVSSSPKRKRQKLSPAGTERSPPTPTWEPSDMCYHIQLQEDGIESSGKTITRKQTLAYTFQLILSICNQTSIDPVIAYRILDEPIAKYAGNKEDEPDKDRRIRLQVRMGRPMSNSFLKREGWDIQEKPLGGFVFLLSRLTLAAFQHFF